MLSLRALVVGGDTGVAQGVAVPGRRSRINIDRFGEMPEDLRLYGGTAVALYLGHRHSTDFGFAGPWGQVTRGLVRRIPTLREGVIEGGDGMVGVLVPGERNVTVTFMEWGRMMPEPVEKPTTADNGVRVAHPVDLVAAKIQARVSRETARDYQDIAAAIDAWWRWTLDGVQAVVDHGMYGAPRIARVLADPPPSALHELGASAVRRLRCFARDLPDRLMPREPER